MLGHAVDCHGNCRDHASSVNVRRRKAADIQAIRTLVRISLMNAAPEGRNRYGLKSSAEDSVLFES